MMIEGNWVIEKHTDHILFLYRIKNHIYHGKTPYHKVDLVELYALGKTLFLDNKIQSAQLDEAVYHEALVHPAMLSHPNPRKVLIMGGGEGATLREVLKHPVEKAVMVDIDEQLVKLCEAYLPEWHRGSFYDERAEVIFADARSYVEEHEDKFDVVISDLTEPMEKGPSVMLFTREFYSPYTIGYPMMVSLLFNLQVRIYALRTLFHMYIKPLKRFSRRLRFITHSYCLFSLTGLLPSQQRVRILRRFQKVI